MSSFTSSSEASRRYVAGLSVLVGVPAVCLFVLCVYLQPLYGDLTRLGGYAEREFGPNKPMQEFSKPLYTSGAYSGYKDVVVLGDSFSRMWPNHQWQNYIAAGTGWSIQTIDIDNTSLRQLVNSPAYRAAPPKLFIYESVERYLPDRIADGQSCSPSSMPQPFRPFGQVPSMPMQTAAAMPVFRARGLDWSEIKLSFGVKYLSSTTRRALTGSDQTEVKKLALSRGGLFSSRNQQALLIYKEDIDKAADWYRTSAPDMACQIESLRQLVEANGRTRFVMMVAPNKLTAYAGHVADKNFAALSRLDQLSNRHPAAMVRLDHSLGAAIQAGEEDVYLPDDTHWGSRGHQIAAATLLAFLRSTNVP